MASVFRPSQERISWECGDLLTRATEYSLEKQRVIVGIVNHDCRKGISGLPEDEPTMWLKLAMACA